MSTITSEIDLDAEGRQVGYLRVPHSVHRSAYGWIPVPIASLRRGEGPVVVLMAGNHGDEYEGQVLVSSLIRELDPACLRGQLILLPMANFPAAEAGLRTSPLDGGNLNRSFPGDARGGPTAAIAEYLERELFARADYLVDLHSGGSSLRYDGGNMLAIEPRDAGEHTRLRGLLNAFGLPRAFLHRENPVLSSGAARRQGAIAITTELGGGGELRPALLREGRLGLLRLLAHVGLLHGPLVPAEAPRAPTRFYRVTGGEQYLYAHDAGLFEPLVELGATVAAGDAAARIHFPDTPLREPVLLRFAAAGELVCRRVPAAVRRGDCLFHLASPLDA
ncbi:succinylglutamate desuccinylase/aspartoacylase family protein [Burkholderia gladioli]|uniref:succinylglutamate desuccinylase/aspartoacylase family protein n=1 Tax=Burkholderia gladioli TaxID=28095 RepID=UPI00164186B2|nr:succinylglutamate desuccinylase/aspartoacylase family protein [Burkholderia gladioli]MBU9215765.1 succinylglutamate desuccinylase/aspartoacylase family protein [Burkholderia gladioli]MDN7721645.1 succinylglutamate desuccinylase/aspartoacylase family protein [Burkholderia gladioli]